MVGVPRPLCKELIYFEIPLGVSGSRPLLCWDGAQRHFMGVTARTPSRREDREGWPFSTAAVWPGVFVLEPMYWVLLVEARDCWGFIWSGWRWHTCSIWGASVEMARFGSEEILLLTSRIHCCVSQRKFLFISLPHFFWWRFFLWPFV